ncbi:MAG TPA: DUF4012 domain-containing protein, partial [Ktedonobacterales bacterium]|nr:DUF4012 domain-containing protein [Ktedonobacterales bacterium]
MCLLALIPAVLIVVEAVHDYGIYTQMQAGIRHLQTAAHVFQGKASNGAAVSYLDVKKLEQVQVEIGLAHTDFVSLSKTLTNDSAASLASPFWPTQVSTARALGRIAVDGTEAAQQVLKTMSDIAPSIALAIKAKPSTTGQPLLAPYITPSSYQEITQTLDTIAPLVHQMALDAQGVTLDSLPISGTQHDMLATLLPLLPVFDQILQQQSAFQKPLEWFLGVDSPRTFLVEPMDNSELRATGGFTGQYGDLILNGGHPSPLKLANLGVYEEDHSFEGVPPADYTIFAKVVGQSAPAPYSDWWPIPNFGVRDANVSADFPTSAKIIMQRYSYEFGQEVDGVILFTPEIIEHVLHVTGPITIAKYNQVVTEKNLIQVLHYYQLDNEGIWYEEDREHVDNYEVARKLFTQRLATALINAVTHLPLSKIVSLAGEMFSAMKSKDLDIYLNNAQAEALIGKYGSTGSMDRSNTHDGLFIVQSNLSASKASQYVATTAQDSITLDDQGGATHQLQLTLDYQQKGSVYGMDTYRDYIRVYVPENSQFISGTGFDQYDRPYCGDAGSGYRLCQSNVYGDGSLICKTPISIGLSASFFPDPYDGTDHPLDVIGPPQNLQSDEPGRAMFGGWVVIPKNCTMHVTLSWYVPPMSQQPYSLLVQAQAGISSPFDLAIQPPTGTCASQPGDTLRASQVLAG